MDKPWMNWNKEKHLFSNIEQSLKIIFYRHHLP